MTDRTKSGSVIDADDLAMEIWRVDGSNELRPGALAKALMPFIESRVAARDVSTNEGGEKAGAEIRSIQSD